MNSLGRYGVSGMVYSDKIVVTGDVLFNTANQRLSLVVYIDKFHLQIMNWTDKLILQDLDVPCIWYVLVLPEGPWRYVYFQRDHCIPCGPYCSLPFSQHIQTYTIN